MLPGPPGVRRLVDTVADRKIGTTQPFAATDINDVRVGGRDRQRSDRTRRLIIEDRVPCPSVVSRLPYAAIVRRHIEDVGLAGYTGNGNSSARSKRPNHAPVQFLIKGRVD